MAEGEGRHQGSSDWLYPSHRSPMRLIMRIPTLSPLTLPLAPPRTPMGLSSPSSTEAGEAPAPSPSR